eukprot:363073-Chlamydomonas_euryale.AAC.2
MSARRGVGSVAPARAAKAMRQRALHQVDVAGETLRHEQHLQISVKRMSCQTARLTRAHAKATSNRQQAATNAFKCTRRIFVYKKDF